MQVVAAREEVGDELRLRRGKRQATRSDVVNDVSIVVCCLVVGVSSKSCREGQLTGAFAQVAKTDDASFRHWMIDQVMER